MRDTNKTNNVTGSGDPAFLLRVLAPSEADFADEASGVHVRFRLGGKSWPPTIFYKIFTHRNVADIGAFAPRDYSHEVKVKQGKKRMGVKEPEEGAKDMALYVRAYLASDVLLMTLIYIYIYIPYLPRTRARACVSSVCCVVGDSLTCMRRVRDPMFSLSLCVCVCVCVSDKNTIAPALETNRTVIRGGDGTGDMKIMVGAHSMKRLLGT